jgi:hypothetical protein
MATMSPRPTPPSDPERPDQPEQPEQPVHPDATPPAAAHDDTAVLPGSPPPPGTPVSTASYAAAGPPHRPQHWWGQATSTSGGRVALAVGAFVLRAVGGGHGDRMAFSERRGPFSDERGPFGDQRGDRPWRGDGVPGERRRDGMVPDGPQGRMVPPTLPDQGRGPAGTGRGMGGLGLGGLAGDVLHGELTATVDGKPTVMVVQTGEVKTYTSGRSLVVRSSDGFEATYVLDGSVVATRGANGLATGAEVRVVAKKEGMSVTRLVVVT